MRAGVLGELEAGEALTDDQKGNVVTTRMPLVTAETQNEASGKMHGFMGSHSIPQLETVTK